MRAETRDGEELVEVMLEVLRDKTASRRDTMQAATWLADRGFGKPVQTLRAAVDESQRNRLALESVPTPELERQLAELRARLKLGELPEKAG